VGDRVAELLQQVAGQRNRRRGRLVGIDQFLYRLVVAYRPLRSAATGETGLSVLLES
jgi:hypothetical protein